MTAEQKQTEAARRAHPATTTKEGPRPPSVPAGEVLPDSEEAVVAAVRKPRRKRVSRCWEDGARMQLAMHGVWLPPDDDDAA